MTKIDSKMLNTDGDAEALERFYEDQRATLEQEREYNTAFMANDDDYEEGMDGDEQYS